MIGPGQNAFSSVPQTTGIWQAAIGALICVAVAFGYRATASGGCSVQPARIRL